MERHLHIRQSRTLHMTLRIDLFENFSDNIDGVVSKSPIKA